MRSLAFAAICVLITTGCTTTTHVHDLQAVFGPPEVAFKERTLWFDLNGDGKDERLLFFTDKRRDRHLPRTVSDIEFVDGFAVFDGIRPNVPVFYVYTEYDGYQLRIDEVDGQRVLVSDGGRDHVQHIWGWWRYPEYWPPAGWEARYRVWDQQQMQFGPWKYVGGVSVIVGK